MRLSGNQNPNAEINESHLECSLLTEWSHISADDSATGRGRFNRMLASDADGQMHEPYLQPADVERINGELALLKEQDAALAAPLTAALQSRLRAWQAAFELKQHPPNVKSSLVFITHRRKATIQYGGTAFAYSGDVA